jgi:isoquinoline 1-oxidoreductase beta subunit
VHQHLLGGGFGRRLEPDMAESAVRIGKHVDGPLKIVWTREEDIRHDVYRPVYRDVISATLADGKIAAWKYRICGSSVMARWLPAGFQDGIDIDAVDSAVDMPYDIPNKHVEYVRVEPPRCGPASGVASGRTITSLLSNASWTSWRGKRAKIRSNFAVALLDGNPRLKAALDLVAEKSGWGQPLPARAGRGVCVQPPFASFIATVVEAEVDEHGEVRLRRVTSAVDTGIAV